MKLTKAHIKGEFNQGFIMQNRFVKTALMSALSVVVLVTAGCHRSIKAEEKKPAKLVKLEQSVSVLNPTFSVSLPQSGGHFKKDKANKKDIIDLQVAQMGQRLIGASRSGLVSAYEGTLQAWSVNVEDAITSGVGVDVSAGVAVVGTRSGVIIAINAQTGEILWQKPLPSASLTPVLVADGRVLVSANNGVLYGLDVQTGALVWQFSTQTPEVSVRGIAKPIRLGVSEVVFGTADGRIHAINSQTGRPLWTRRVGRAVGGSQVNRMSDVDGAPLVVGNHLYVPSYSGQLAGFDMSTGQAMFVAPFASIKTLTTKDNLLIGSSIDGDVVAFDRITGEKQWENNQLKYRKLTNPVAIGDYIFVGDFDGVIHVFNDAGQIVGRYNLKGQLTSLQVIDGYLYAQSTNDVVAVFKATSAI